MWERNLIISQRIESLVQNGLLLWPQTKLLPHHFSYLCAPINLRFNYWHLPRGNYARYIGHHQVAELHGSSVVQPIAFDVFAVLSDWVFAESSSAVEPMDLPTVAP